MFYIIISLLVLGVFAVASVNVWYDTQKQKENQALFSQFSKGEHSKTLVAFYSRSGNTELMARKIAEMKHAHLIPIETERDKVSYKGMLEAILDARKQSAEISPKTLDLSAYDTIYIGSPVWLYAPAPPIYEFAKNNDFTGKKVILFNSMNSKFEQRFIDDFRKIIEQKGGTLEKHLYIIRGRLGQQMTSDEFLKEVERVAD